MSQYLKRLLADNQWAVVSENPLLIRHFQSRKTLTEEESVAVLENLDREASERDTREMPAFNAGKDSPKQEPTR